MTKIEEEYSKPTKSEVISLIKENITNLEKLPSGAMLTPATHYDLYTLYCVLLALAALEED